MILNYGKTNNRNKPAIKPNGIFMKTIQILTISLITIISTIPLPAQVITIQGPRKVSFDDTKEFCKSAYSDTAWKDLPQLKWTDNRKTTANRLLEMRKHVVISSSLKPAFKRTGLLSLSMGNIGQSDDTYLNGKLIGSAGSGDTYHNYLVGTDDILWNQGNVIATRVRHWGSFQVSKVPIFVAAAPEYLFVYCSGLKNGDKKAPVLNKLLLYQLSVKNDSRLSADIVMLISTISRGIKLVQTEKMWFSA